MGRIVVLVPKVWALRQNDPKSFNKNVDLVFNAFNFE